MKPGVCVSDYEKEWPEQGEDAYEIDPSELPIADFSDLISH